MLYFVKPYSSLKKTVLRDKKTHLRHCEYIERPGIEEAERVHFSTSNKKHLKCNKM